MTRFKILLLNVTLILVLSACSPSLASPTIASTLLPTQQPTAEAKTITVPAPTQMLPASDADVPRVSVTDAKAAFDKGQAIIIDVRTKAAYEASHIKGALYLGDLEDSQMNLTVPKNQWIITYCT